MQSQEGTGNSLECQYSAVRVRAILSLPVLLNEIFSHFRLSCDIVETEVDIPGDRAEIVKEISYCNIFWNKNMLNS